LGNRKSSEKLTVPKWFQLKKYDKARDLLTPRAWFEQIALRIDLKILKLNHDELKSQSPCEPIDKMEEKALDEIRFLVHHDPIVDTAMIVKRYGWEGFPFDTLAMLGSKSECVRPMTTEDLYMAETSLEPDIRIGRVIFTEAWSRRLLPA
jgi:hypothetical protein